MTDAEAEAIARAAGLDVRYARVSEDRICIEYREGLTFEQLTAVSDAFGTKRIDLGIDEGCASDPSCDPYLVIWVAP